MRLTWDATAGQRRAFAYELAATRRGILARRRAMHREYHRRSRAIAVRAAAAWWVLSARWQARHG